MTNSEARKRNQAARTPQRPHQQPNAPGVDSGSIGRLSAAETHRWLEALLDDEYGEQGWNDLGSLRRIARALNGHFAEKISAHVTAALAEVESRISSSVSPNFGMRHDGTEDPQAMAYVEGLHDAHVIVRDYREGVGR